MKEYVAVILLHIDFHEISPKGEIDGKAICVDGIKTKNVIQIKGKTLEDVTKNVKDFLQSPNVYKKTDKLLSMRKENT